MVFGQSQGRTRMRKHWIPAEDHVVGQQAWQRRTGIVTAQLPLFTKQCAKGDWSGAMERMKNTLLITSVIQIGIALFLYFISPFVVGVWVGPNNYIKGNVLLFFVINYLLTCLLGLLAQFVLASGRNPFAISTILHGILTLGGMAVLCPNMGLIGVPLAGLFGVVLTNFWVNPIEALRTWQTLKQRKNSTPYCI